MRRRIVVKDPMQPGYSYELSAPQGKEFDPRFKPQLTPKEMLALGVFGGNYFQYETDEYPEDWFAGAIESDTKQGKLNYFRISASQPLSVWQAKGWIYKDDPRGWFQWYCRYYLGRRIPKEDDRQIKRWLAIGRHIRQVQNNCRKGDETCRPRQRQAILHWAYDSRRI